MSTSRPIGEIDYVVQVSCRAICDIHASGDVDLIVRQSCERTGEFDHYQRITVEGAFANGRTAIPVEVEDWGKGQIDAAGTQLDGKNVAHSRCRLAGGAPILIPQRAEATHRRQAGESLTAALHPTPFVVDGDQEFRLAQRTHLGG